MGAKKKEEPFTRAQRMMGIGIAMGSAFGVVLGVIIDNIGIGIAIGVTIGILFGAAFRAQKKTMIWAYITSFHLEVRLKFETYSSTRLSAFLTSRIRNQTPR